MAELKNTTLFHDANLQGYYRLETGLTTDESGNGRTLTNNNTVAVAAGEYGNAADFGTGNTNKYLSRDNDSYGISGQVFSIVGWAKSSETPGNEEQDGIFSIVVAGAGSFYLRYFKSTAGSAETDLVRNNGLSQETIVAASFPGVGVWAHYAITANGAVMELFINGVSQGTSACSQVVNGSVTQFTIGESAGGLGRPFDGVIDDVAVFNRVLTASEILNLLASNPGTTTSTSTSSSTTTTSTSTSTTTTSTSSSTTTTSTSTSTTTTTSTSTTTTSTSTTTTSTSTTTTSTSTTTTTTSTSSSTSTSTSTTTTHPLGFSVDGETPTHSLNLEITGDTDKSETLSFSVDTEESQILTGNVDTGVKQ